MVLRHSAVSGRRAGWSAAAGIGGGILVWSFVAAIGLASLLAASATAYTVVKIAGAAYLVYLGARALWAAKRGEYGDSLMLAAKHSALRAFRQGLLCNVLNPKCAVFFVALLPQFLPERSSLGDILLLALVTLLITLVWFGSVATVVSAMRRLLAATRIRRTIDAITGTVLVALGIKIATQTSP